MVRAHAINAADSGSIPAGGPLLHVTSLSPIFPICLLLNKGVYAEKIKKKKKKKKETVSLS